MQIFKFPTRAFKKRNNLYYKFNVGMCLSLNSDGGTAHTSINLKVYF